VKHGNILITNTQILLRSPAM